MIIKITWKTVAAVAGLAVTGYLAYKALKAEAKAAEELKAHKEEVLGDRDLFDEYNEKTLNNEMFNPEERSDAYEVLEDLYNKVNTAKSIESFDEALKSFDEAMGNFRGKDPEAAKACVRVYKNRLDRRREEARENARKLAEDRRYASRNRTEADKAKKLAEAIKSLDVGKNDQVSNLLNEAQEIMLRY